MKPMNRGFSSSSQRIDVEEIISAFDRAKMRFFIRGTPDTRTVQELVNLYFPDNTQLTPVPVELQGKAWPWELWDDPFVEASCSLDAARASYLAPAVHWNHYLDWLLFDFECEAGDYREQDYEDRPSNIARRSYFEVFAHSVLIALKSALDRLVGVIAHYVAGISPHMTWGRIKNDRFTGLMSVIEKERKNDSLFEFLHAEYHRWISKMVAPRDDIIHYADLQTLWQFDSVPHAAEDFRLSVSHGSPREDESEAFNSQMLFSYVQSFYAVADRILLTLSTRLPLGVRRRVSGGSLGDAIMSAFGLGPSSQIGELKRAIDQAISSGEIDANQEPHFYIDFLRQNKVRFGITAI